MGMYMTQPPNRPTASQAAAKQPSLGDAPDGEKPGVERTMAIVVIIIVLGGALTLGLAVALFGLG